MSLKRKAKKVTVDFAEMRREPARQQTPPERRHGGCGTHEAPVPYTGGVLEFVGKGRRFTATWGRSPGGSGVGTFRIDEHVKSRSGDRIIQHGYHCSYPDFEACVRVASESGKK